MQMCDMVLSVMSRSHRIKGGTSDKVFQAHRKQCFLCERGAPISADFDLFYNFEDLYMHKNLYNTLKVRGKSQKHNRSP